MKSKPIEEAVCRCGHKPAQHSERTVTGNDPPEEFVERKCTVRGCVCVDTRVRELGKIEGSLSSGEGGGG